MSPSDWAVSTLANLAAWSSGGTPRAGEQRFYRGGTTPWATISDLRDAVLGDTRSHITDEGLRHAGRRLAPTGAVLVSMYGTIGKTALTSVPMATNQAIAVGTPDLRVVTPEFLWYAVQARRLELDARGRGATQRNINRSMLEETVVHVPPLHEQRMIVGLLASATDYLAALGAEVEAARHVAGELVADLSGDSTRALSEILTVATHRVARSSAEDLDLASMRNEFRGLARKSTLRAAGLVYPEVNLLETGRLVMSKIRAVDGGFALVTDEFNGAVLSPEFPTFALTAGINPGWLLLALQTSRVRDQLRSIAVGTGGGKTRVSPALLLTVRVPWAALDEQHRVVNLVSSASNHTAALEQKSAAARHLRDQLLHDLLSGQHRIPASYTGFLSSTGDGAA